MTTYSDSLHQYIVDLYARPDAALVEGQRIAADAGLPAISVNPEEGRFLQVLVRAAGVRCAVEIGTLGGFSGTWIARGLPHGGKLITLEKDPHHAEIARQNFARGGVTDRVDIRVGDAHQLLDQIAREDIACNGLFDFVFIDADKTGYPYYFSWALDAVRVGGLIVAHNAFRGGRVLATGDLDEGDRAMQEFNRQVADEPRVLSTIYPAGDGTLLAVRIA
ncbi:MAG TPA: O-methyltransferase [Anaerolineaceae bacterium]|nr:O-methyltransferase [Anaerolineaceae bacterium]